MGDLDGNAVVRQMKIIVGDVEERSKRCERNQEASLSTLQVSSGGLRG